MNEVGLSSISIDEAKGQGEALLYRARKYLEIHFPIQNFEKILPRISSV